MTWNTPQPTEFAIGIDIGVKTGIGTWDRKKKKIIEIKTLMIHRAMDYVKKMHDDGHKIIVRVEDAREVVYKTDPIKAQGAGSVKRDAKIWEDFLSDHGIPFEMVRPNKAITKWSKERFILQTGYTGITSSHGRDAAMLVIGY